MAIRPPCALALLLIVYVCIWLVVVYYGDGEKEMRFSFYILGSSCTLAVAPLQNQGVQN